MSTSRITVSFKVKDHRELQKLADENDVSIAWVVRKAVNEYLERNSTPQSELTFEPTERDVQQI